MGGEQPRSGNKTQRFATKLRDGSARPLGDKSTHMARIDTVVIGLGVMGSAALRSLAGRGVRVLGIEHFAPGHDRGSLATA